MTRRRSVVARVGHVLVASHFVEPVRIRGEVTTGERMLEAFPRRQRPAVTHSPFVRVEIGYTLINLKRKLSQALPDDLQRHELRRDDQPESDRVVGYRKPSGAR